MIQLRCLDFEIVRANGHLVALWQAGAGHVLPHRVAVHNDYGELAPPAIASLRMSSSICKSKTVERERAQKHAQLARSSAIRSLKYSIGILHPDYKEATE